MLLSALSLACFLAVNVVNGQSSCPLFGTTPSRVTEKSNYVIDYFSDQLLFTYAIDKCTATSILPGSWYKYTCVKGNNGAWSVEKKKYTSADCSSSSNSNTAIFFGNSSQGELGYFECAGADNYVEVEVSINPDCSGSQVVAAGLGGCTHNSPLLTEFYCDDTQALVQLYVDPDSLTTTAEPSNDTATTKYESTVVCSSSLYCNKWTFVSECENVAELLGTSIYGKLDKCFISAGTATTEDNSAASSLFVITNLVFALIVTLFSLF